MVVEGDLVVLVSGLNAEVEGGGFGWIDGNILRS